MPLLAAFCLVRVWVSKEDSRMTTELTFDVTQEADGGFVAEAVGEDIFTQGNTWDELCRNVREAVAAHFFDGQSPTAVRLHLVRDEVLTPA